MENNHVCRSEDWWTYHDGVTRCVGCKRVKPRNLLQWLRETLHV